MKNTILSVLVVILLSSFTAKAQYFTDIKADLTHVMYAGGTWIDKDDDGDLDLIISGGFLNGDAPLESSKFYTNVNREKYFRYLKTSVTNVTRGAIDAGDYDNDGDLDLILTGRTRQGEPVTQLYRNERNNVFRKVGIAVPSLFNGDVKFADFNRDGNQDIAICGKDANEEVHTLVYAGDGKGGFESVRIPAVGVHNGELAWGDYDNDGDYDLFVTGQQSNGKGFTGLYVFNGTAFGKLNIEMPARKFSSADWGDYDNDGDLDIVLNGEGDNQSVTLRILNNMGGNQFMNINLSLPGTR
ncbi:MAG TPA: VCBS repeat-containing protein, partial [Bacteroidales bacterium]|nr:VCBS repeat-containing protein [Bacteroidales bacterium]